jgi:hypothetical protein
MKHIGQIVTKFNKNISTHVFGKDEQLRNTDFDFVVKNACTTFASFSTYSPVSRNEDDCPE